jgi:Ni,Fe-hydrogenase I large subunit
MGTVRTKVVIDPMTRIEGHLKVDAVVEGGSLTPT